MAPGIVGIAQHDERGRRLPDTKDRFASFALPLEEKSFVGGKLMRGRGEDGVQVLQGNAGFDRILRMLYIRRQRGHSWLARRSVSRREDLWKRKIRNMVH
jgi:hypothetical protein